MEVKAEVLSEEEAQLLQKYSGLNLAQMQEELDRVERALPEDGRAAGELERHEKVLRGALESEIWRGYLGLDQAELEEELAEVRQQITAAQAKAEGAVEVRNLGRVEKVLMDMIKEWG
jgi:glutamine synthetase